MSSNWYLIEELPQLMTSMIMVVKINFVLSHKVNKESLFSQGKQDSR